MQKTKHEKYTFFSAKTNPLKKHLLLGDNKSMNLIEELTSLIEARSATGLERFKERLNDWLISEEERDVLFRLATVSLELLEEDIIC